MRNKIIRILICLMTFSIAPAARAAAVIDRGFGTNGAVTTAMNAQAQAKAVLVQPDGKILVVGDAAPAAGAKRDIAYARYNANGTLDTTFGFGGKAFISVSADNDLVAAAALQPDGKILIAGSTESTPGSTNTDFFVIRVDSGGAALDAQFGNLGIVTINQSSFDAFQAVAVQPDGKIVAAGSTSQNGYEFAVVRFNANGSLDQSFANGGLLFYDLGPFIGNQSFFAAALLPNGRILLGGTANDGNGGLDVLMMLETNGALAQNFGNGGIRLEYFGTYSAGSTYDLKVLPDGRILTLSQRLFRRLLSNGADDLTFRRIFAPTNGIDNAGTAFGVRSDGRIIVLNQGTFNLYNAVAFEKNGRQINYVRNLRGADIAVQSDDKFLLVNSSDAGFVLSRYVAVNSPATRIADFDYDGISDLIVARAGETVYVERSAQSVVSYTVNRGAGEGVRFIPEDIYSNNPDQFPLLYWRYSGENNPAFFENAAPNGARAAFQWGVSTDIPVGGDYDGEPNVYNAALIRKSTEYAVFRPSTGDWWIYNRRSNTFSTYHWGASGDKPVPADYDYDGITDFAVYRPQTGTWWIHRSSDDSYFTIQFGAGGDTPLTGDYDGDGRADFTVYRAAEGNWYQFLTSEGFRVVRFGLPTDYPVPGDYDGDGRHDIAVYREGVWYLLQSSNGLKIVQWGKATDAPVAVRYDQ